jgi:ClpP class serine protease
VHRESIRRGEHSEFDSLFAPFSPEEAERLKQHLDEFYRENFVRKVAEGRKMSEDDVDRAGRGRVWSGARAAQQRLLDRIGGLDDAVVEARKLAGLPDRKKVRLVHYARRRRLRDMVLPDFAPQFEAAWMPPGSAEIAEVLRRLTENTILLWMPFQIRIR